jgi:hypothetical protein
MFTASEREHFAVHYLLKRRNILALEKLANATP